MVEAASGIVIRYDYLWAHQADRGEESGRKDRPCCLHVMIRKPDGSAISALFPITSRPDASRIAIEIPDTELRRIGLSVTSWVIVDEWNLDDLSESPYVADPRPLGAFSTAFMRRIQTQAAKAIRSRAYRSIP